MKIKLFEEFSLNENTPNFYNKNASHVFAFGMSDPDADPDDDDLAQINFDDELDYIKDQLKEAGFDDDKGSPDDDNRSYSGQIIASKTESKDINGEMGVEVRIYAIARSAYHEGANLDWSVDFFLNGEKYDPDDVDKDQVISAFNLEEDEKKDELADQAMTELETLKDKLVNEIEDVFEEVCSHKLTHLGTASNGEAFYKAVEKKKKKKKETKRRTIRNHRLQNSSKMEK